MITLSQPTEPSTRRTTRETIPLRIRLKGLQVVLEIKAVKDAMAGRAQPR